MDGGEARAKACGICGRCRGATRGYGARVNDLDAVRAHFRIARATLIAHSYGPLLAATYALAHPERVRRMVLLGPVPPRRGDFWHRFAANSAARMDSTLTHKLSDAYRRLTAATTDTEIPGARR